MRLSYNN